MKRCAAVALLIIGTAGTEPASADTVLSGEFLHGQSTVIQTGGIAGIYEAYSVEGGFLLRVDYDGGVAFFDHVDALLDPGSVYLPTESLADLFNMTKLTGTIIGETRIEFVGKTASEPVVDINVLATFQDDLIYLTGSFDQNAGGGADFFVYDLDAVALAVPEPASLWLMGAAGAGWIVVGRRRFGRQSSVM